MQAAKISASGLSGLRVLQRQAGNGDSDKRKEEAKG